MPKAPYLPCGKIVSTHGVRGTVRLESYCDSPKVLATLRTMYRKEKDGTMRPLRVLASSVQKQMVLCTFASVTTLDEAIPLKGTELYAARADLPLAKGAHFLADLMGLPVVDADTGTLYGTLKEVTRPGVQDLYTVEEPDGRTFLIPAVPEFIRRIETDGAEAGVYVHLIEGMRDGQ